MISAGTSVRESVNLILASGATPGGVVIALDRMERGSYQLSAVQEVKKTHDIPVTSIIDLNSLINFLQDHNDLLQNLHAVEQYREQYGVAETEN